MRFGLEDGVTHTLEEIGKAMQVTRERVRQLEQNSLKKLKNEIERQRKEFDFISHEEVI